MITFPLLREFVINCEIVDVEPPPPVIKGLALIEKAYASAAPTPRRLLDLQDDDLTEVLEGLAIRQHKGIRAGEDGISAALPGFDAQLLHEVRTATLPLLDGLISDLQPRFDSLVAPIITAVQQHAFTGRTSAHQVLQRRSWEDSSAFLAAQDAMRTVQTIISFRQTISSTFDVAPIGQPVDYSVAFAAGDNWSFFGDFNREQKHPGIVDLVALAAGGLHLNTVTEVTAKLQARRDSEFEEAHPEAFKQTEPSWTEADLEAAVDQALDGVSKES